MTIKLTPGRALARQRQNHLRKLERVRKQYDAPAITDEQIKALLDETIAFVKADVARYNAQPGGLGK